MTLAKLALETRGYALLSVLHTLLVGRKPAPSREREGRRSATGEVRPCTGRASGTPWRLNVPPGVPDAMPFAYLDPSRDDY